MAVGDRVAYTGQEFKARLGAVGRVVAERKGPGKQVGVEFEVDVGGHSCDGVGKVGRCWWVLPGDVKKVGKDFKRKV